MKRIYICLLAGWMFCAQTAFAAEPRVTAQGAALLDAETGRLLWGKNEEEPLEMASTTKIMTAILVLEKGNPNDVVTVSKHAARQPDVQMGLKEGEQWYEQDLLTAMMLKSYNDAAVALAEQISGSVEAFCQEMTEKAKAIGAKDTVFGSPNGLDSHLTKDQHHSTAYDMGLIAGYALQNPTFRQIVATPSETFTDVSGKISHTSVNTDRFLQMYSGALGVKTGYTNKAGNCFVGAATQDEVTLVSVVLGCGWGEAGKQAKWMDTKALMDYGFDTYEKQTVAKAGTIRDRAAVSRSPVSEVDVGLASDYQAVLSEEEAEQIQITAKIPAVLEAPLQKGTVVGQAEIRLGDSVLGDVELLTMADAPTYTLVQQYHRLLEVWCDWAVFL